MYYNTLFEPTFISSSQDLVKKWSIGLLKELLPDFQRPSKKLDHQFSGEYDFLLNWADSKNRPHVIHIKVKASRAVDFDINEPLYVKALSSDSDKPFDMNMQQIKPSCCHVFVWIAAWRDVIRYWVLSSLEVENNKYFSKGQHRGNIGEGQLHLKRENIKEFSGYEVKPNQLLKAIRKAYKRQMQNSIK